MYNNQRRILDRSLYNQQTLSTYGIIGAYIVDIYYNHLYIEAVKLKNDRAVSSITEGYKHAVSRFISTIDSESEKYKLQHYTHLLTGINEYFKTWTSFSTLNLSDCINKITQEFIPEDFFPSLDKDRKREILRFILINTMKEFTKIIITEYLANIIDNHNDTANVEALKDKMIDLFLMEREAMYHRFLDSQIGKSHETVDKQLAVKMQAEIKMLLREKKLLEKSNNEFEKIVEIRTQQLQKVLTQYKLLMKKYQILQEDYNNMKMNVDVHDDIDTHINESSYQSQQQPYQSQQQPYQSQQQPYQSQQQPYQSQQQTVKPKKQRNKKKVVVETDQFTHASVSINNNYNDINNNGVNNNGVNNTSIDKIGIDNNGIDNNGIDNNGINTTTDNNTSALNAQDNLIKQSNMATSPKHEELSDIIAQKFNNASQLTKFRTNMGDEPTIESIDDTY